MMMGNHCGAVTPSRANLPGTPALEIELHMATPRNRIIDHRWVKAKDLVPHELNPRVHSQDQRDALAAIYREVGFARSVLAYELPDGRLKLIDGHLRTAESNPDEDIAVEVLDVTDSEARKLLLTIDPLAALAAYSDDQLSKLRDITKADDQMLNALWSTLHQTELPKIRPDEPAPRTEPIITSQWLVIIDCANERQQAENLATVQQAGMVAKAVSS